MKIRWTSQSVRLRITPSELTALQQGECAEEEIELPGGGGWATRIIPNMKETSAYADRETLHLYLTADDLVRLSDETLEGIYFEETDPPLRYCIEKDFPCAHPRPSQVQEPPTEVFAPNASFTERKANS